MARNSSNSFDGEGKEAHVNRLSTGVGEDNQSGGHLYNMDGEVPDGNDVGPEGRSSSPGSSHLL